MVLFFFFKQKTAYEITASDWSSDVCSSDLPRPVNAARATVRAKLWGTFRCQTYWLLATRGAWRVLWALLRTGRYAPAKTDRVTGAASPRPAARRWTRR